MNIEFQNKLVTLTEAEIDLWTLICQDARPLPPRYIVLRGRLLAKLGVSSNYGAIKRAIETGFVFVFSR